MSNKKNKKIAIIIIAVLIVVFIIALVVFINSNQENVDLYNSEKIKITYGEELLGEYTLQELLDISSGVEFEAIYKPSGKQPIEREYTGIYIKDLFEKIDINLEEIQRVKFRAMDGYMQIYNVNTILEEDNVYIAYLVNGEPFNTGINSLAYYEPQEDGGPFVIIRAQDDTSQYRVKLVTEIIIE